MDMVNLKVGDTVDLGGFPYSTANVARVYRHETCGWRADLVRPYVLHGENGPEVGVEKVDFVDVDRLKVVRRG
jgi:hypothetical protein